MKKDPKKALVWYYKAADNGDGYAMSVIGQCYEQGMGVDKDEIKALAWYEKSAQAGGSCGVVAMLLLLGQKEKLTEAECRSFMRAVGQIDPEYGRLLAASGFYIALEMIRYASTRQTGIQIISLSAESGKADAQLWLAEAYAVGEYMLQDRKQAAYWYQKVADQGNETAKARLQALSRKELTEDCVIALVRKHHLEDKFLTSVMPGFGKKLPKAVNAYAYSAMREKPLLMEDTTLLGSGKEGFVLTHKTLFHNGGLRAGKSSYPLERIQSVTVRTDKAFCIRLEIAPPKSGGSYTALDVTYTNNKDEADRLEAFWKDLLESLQKI